MCPRTPPNQSVGWPNFLLQGSAKTFENFFSRTFPSTVNSLSPPIDDNVVHCLEAESLVMSTMSSYFPFTLPRQPIPHNKKNEKRANRHKRMARPPERNIT